MESEVFDPQLKEAIEHLDRAVALLQQANLTPLNVKDAKQQILELNQLNARWSAVKVASLSAIDTSGVYREDGHHSAKVMVRHIGNLSGGEAAALDRTRKALVDMPDLREGFEAGTIGECQARRLAKTWANKRTREKLAVSEPILVKAAQQRSFNAFDDMLTQWERLADEDGTQNQAERDHNNRVAKLIQEYDDSWTLSGKYGSYMGAQMREIYDHYITAELMTDWEKVRADLGDDATEADLPRTDAQRRADALWQVFQDAVTASPDGKAPRWVSDVLIDEETFNRELAKIEGESVPETDPDRETYVCGTKDGHRVNPAEAVAETLVGAARRAVMSSDSTIIDLGKQRIFTGSARLAAMLSSNECFWAGCHTPVSRTQIDHMTPYAKGGLTNQENAVPACGRHNRLKEHGYKVWRDPGGTIHTIKPDGTRLE